MNKKRIISLVGICFAIIAVLISFVLLKPLIFKDDAPATKPYLDAFNLSPEEEKVIYAIYGTPLENITEEMVTSVNKITVASAHIVSSGDPTIERGGSYKVRGKRYNFTDSEGFGNELSALRVFNNLQTIYIYYAPKLTDISFITDLKKLNVFSVTMSGIKDAAPISECPHLSSVYFYYSPIEKIELSPDNGITQLVLQNTMLTDLSFLYQASDSIERLHIFANKLPLENTDVLKKFKNLKALHIGAPDLSLEFMDNIWNISELRIGYTDSIDLSHLKAIEKSLEYFAIAFSDNTDLSYLDNMPKLEKIEIAACNNITRGELTKEGSEYIYFESQSDLFDFFSWFEYAP